MTKALPEGLAIEPMRDLIARVAAHDPLALRRLYDCASPRLFGLALRILRKDEWAEEVLQEAFVTIWRFAGEYRESTGAPMAWMTSIVRSRALDHLRHQKAFGAGVEVAWDDSFASILPTDDLGPSELALLSEHARYLARCMARLDASQRMAINLAYLCEQTHCEIAESVHAPVGTVKSRIRRGLQALKACLNDIG